MTDILPFRVPWRLTAAVGALLVPAMLTGCALPGFFAHAVAPPVKAKHKLANVPTLVLVDDFDSCLEDPALTNFIAGQIGENLKHERALKTTIPIAKVNAVAAELGEKYRQTSVPRVGRMVGAGQVICVNIIGVSIMADPGIMSPTAELWVKVFEVDAKDNRRVFPPARGGAPGRPPPPRGHPLVVQLPHRYMVDGDRALTQVVMRDLAERIARDVARLFHSYDPRGPSES